MSASQYPQYGYELGEVSETFDWRADLKVRDRSLKRASNGRPRYSGVMEGRFGSTRLFEAAGDGWIHDMAVEGVSYMLIVTAEAVDIRLVSDRSQVGSISSCPWTADMLPELVIETWGSQAFIFHQDMAPQIIERADDGTWSRTAWAPVDGTGGTIRQPYFRFADRGVTLTPSARTGSVTLTASAAAFTSDMVGLRLRLLGTLDATLDRVGALVERLLDLGQRELGKRPEHNGKRNQPDDELEHRDAKDVATAFFGGQQPGHVGILRCRRRTGPRSPAAPAPRPGRIRESCSGG